MKRNPIPPLALDRGDPPISGHITNTASGATAWYVLAPLRRSFRPDTDVESDILEMARGLGHLVGRRVHIRKTARVWSADGWAEAMAPQTPQMRRYVEQERAYLSGLQLSDKVVFAGVSLHRALPAAGLFRRLPMFQRQAEERQAEEVADIERVMLAPGVGARRADQHEVEWLILRSLLLCCPTPPEPPRRPGEWTREDIAQLADRVYPSVEPYGQWVELVPRRLDGPAAPTFTAVLTMGRTDWLEPGWLAETDRLGFHVETSVRSVVVSNAEVSKRMRSALDRIKHRTQDYLDKGKQPPWSLPESERQALGVQHTVDRGRDRADVRTRTQVSWGVGAQSERQLRDRCQKLIDLYPNVDIGHPHDQFGLYRSFIPGEPPAPDGYCRRWPTRTLVAALPQATKRVGDAAGMVLGHTLDGFTRTAVCWDLHRSITERERSGLVFVNSKPGGGKSTMLGLVAVYSATSGVPTLLVDPADRLSAICDISWLRPDARHIKLLEAPPGTLSPYRVIPEPKRANYATQDEYMAAVKSAQATRVVRAIDTCLMFLPPATAMKDQTAEVLWLAAGGVEAYPQASVMQVISRLKAMGVPSRRPGAVRRPNAHAATVGRMLEQVAKLPAAQLVFPSGYGLPDDDALLTVLSMKGLVFPDQRTEPAKWSTDEWQAMALLSQAAWLSRRFVEALPATALKTVLIDEGHRLEAVSSGQMFLNSAARDSRGNRERVIVASQGAGDMVKSLAGADLIDGVFVGQTEGHRVSAGAEDHQAAALHQLGVEVGAGFEKVLGTLSRRNRDTCREFVWADGAGGIEIVVVDLAHHDPEVRQALQPSQPSQPRARRPRTRKTEVA
jgi:hypothetical protein